MPTFTALLLYSFAIYTRHQARGSGFQARVKFNQERPQHQHQHQLCTEISRHLLKPSGCPRCGPSLDRTGLEVNYTSHFCVIFKPLITFTEVHNSQDGAAASLAQLIGRHADVQASVAGAAVTDPEPPRVLGL